MNYIVWQYIFGFFLVAFLICISITVILSVRYRLISLIRSDLNLRKNEKNYQNYIDSAHRTIEAKGQYNSNSSGDIKQINDASQNNSSFQIDDNSDIILSSGHQNNTDITELLHQTNYSDDQTQIICDHSITKTDDISSDNTVIADRGSTSTVIINNNISSNNCNSPSYDSFVMVMDIKITNGKTYQIKKFR